MESSERVSGGGGGAGVPAKRAALVAATASTGSPSHQHNHNGEADRPLEQQRPVVASEASCGGEARHCAGSSGKLLGDAGGAQENGRR